MSTYHPNLLITGGSGQLASALLHHPIARHYRLTVYSHEEMDIANASSIQRVITKQRPDFIINTAAYTKVDQAELEQAQAMATNYKGAQQLANICQQNKIPLIHLSTDYVFDGENNLPYAEDRPVNPLQVYGQSKWLGEEAIRQTCEQFIILRVSGIFSEYGHNFVKTILRIAKEKKCLRVVSDQLTCPTYAGDIASVIFTILKNIKQIGTFHFCSQPPISWHQFAMAIIQEASIYFPHDSLLHQNEVQAISTADYPTLAKRPRYSVFDCQKIKDVYGMTPASWIIGLQQTCKHLTSEMLTP